jgi:hypothetical protein
MKGTGFTRCKRCERLLMVSPVIITGEDDIREGMRRGFDAVCSTCVRPERERRAVVRV